MTKKKTSKKLTDEGSLTSAAQAIGAALGQLAKKAGVTSSSAALKPPMEKTPTKRARKKPPAKNKSPVKQPLADGRRSILEVDMHLRSTLESGDKTLRTSERRRASPAPTPALVSAPLGCDAATFVLAIKVLRVSAVGAGCPLVIETLRARSGSSPRKSSLQFPQVLVC